MQKKHLFENNSSNQWERMQSKNIATLFTEMRKKVPAYRNFLAANAQKGKSGSTVSSPIPAVTKKIYFNKYSLAETMWPQTFKKNHFVMTATSGSTGQPTYFARTEVVDYHFSLIAEHFLSIGPKGNTLVLDCFGMGVWIGGLITYQAFHTAGLRGYPVTILTPGINKKEIFHALTELAPQYDNVIICGYPPFIKDLLDEAIGQEINFSAFHARLLFAAEGFSESFRDYVAKSARIKNIYTDTMNIYGSAELGSMAFETPLSIFIRRKSLKNHTLGKTLFLENKLPTFAQYCPQFINFEIDQGSVLITANSASPFMKYAIGDHGDVWTYTEIIKRLGSAGLDVPKELKKQYTGATYELPFVAVYERSDFSTKLYGAIMYPEHIREALLHSKVTRYTTGKFIMMTTTDNTHAQRLEIVVELKSKVKATQQIQQTCVDVIVETLQKRNAEYKNNYHSMKSKVVPVIKLRAYADPEYFSGAGKQRWVI